VRQKEEQKWDRCERKRVRRLLGYLGGIGGEEENSINVREGGGEWTIR